MPNAGSFLHALARMVSPSVSSAFSALLSSKASKLRPFVIAPPAEAMLAHVS